MNISTLSWPQLLNLARFQRRIPATLFIAARPPLILSLISSSWFPSLFILIYIYIYCNNNCLSQYLIIFHNTYIYILQLFLDGKCEFYFAAVVCWCNVGIYTGCNRRNVRDFWIVFLMLNCTDITQNTYIQSRTVTEIMAIEMCGLLGCRRTVRRPWRHTCPMRPPARDMVMQ